MSRLKSNSRSVAILLFLMALPLGEIWAQEFNLGVFGGLNATQVDRDGYGGYNNLGLTAGVFVNRSLGKDFYWQLELKYGHRGAYYLGENVVEDYHKTSFQYIELPLSVQYLHMEKYQFGIGLSPDVLLKFVAYDDQRNEVPLEEELGGNRRFGLNAFAGFQYWFHPTIGVGLRFTYSVIPYSLRDGASVRYLDSGYFHNVLSLTAAYRIMHR